MVPTVLLSGPYSKFLRVYNLESQTDNSGDFSLLCAWRLMLAMLRDYEVLGTELRTVTYKARNLIPDYFSIVSLKGVLVSQLCCLFQIALDILEALLYT